MWLCKIQGTPVRVAVAHRRQLGVMGLLLCNYVMSDMICGSMSPRVQNTSASVALTADTGSGCSCTQKTTGSHGSLCISILCSWEVFLYEG